MGKRSQRSLEPRVRIDVSLLEAVRREVASCVRDRSVLHTSTAAKRIRRKLGKLPLNTVTPMLIEAGTAASVALEIEEPEHRFGSEEHRFGK